MKRLGRRNFQKCALHQDMPAATPRYGDKPHTSPSVLEILGNALTIILLIGEAENEIDHQITVWRVRYCWNYHVSHAILLSLPKLRRSYGMRTELR
jgi:hypothetical protein